MVTSNVDLYTDPTFSHGNSSGFYMFPVQEGKEVSGVPITTTQFNSLLQDENMRT